MSTETLTEGIIRSSNKVLTVTSENLTELRNEINDAQDRWNSLKETLDKKKLLLNATLVLKILSKILVIGFFIKKPDELYNKYSEEVKELETKLSETYVKLEFADKSQLEKSWLNCIDTFGEMVSSEKMWDLTYSEKVDNVKMRTIAKTGIKRTPLAYSTKELDFIHSDLEPLFLPNANGADIYVYPKFLIFAKDKNNFGLIDLRDVVVTFELTGYVETDRVPKDTEIVDHTWAKTNKDGSQDRRYKENYQIPVVKYGQLTFKSDSGLDESYMLSNPDTFMKFQQAYTQHLGSLK